MLYQQLKKYQAKTEQEQNDIQKILFELKHNQNIYYRSSLSMHITVSAIIIDQFKTKVLFIYHNIYDAWGWVGGHADGDEDLYRVAFKEIEEETGLNKVSLLMDDILMVDVLPVIAHQKNGEKVSEHYHANITYLFEANEYDQLRVNPQENQAVKWFTFSDALNIVSENHMIPVYKKAFDFIQSLYNNK